jgi:prophage antirepressor-like protein
VFIVELENQSNQLATYFYDNQEIRVFLIDGELWFVLSDLLAFIGSSTSIGDCIAVVKRYFGGEAVISLPLKTEGGVQSVKLVKECGATLIVSRSRTDAGVRLTRLIHDEILPSIRKTGGYTVASIDVKGVIQQTATITAQETAQHFLPYVEECQKMEKTYEEFPGLKTLIQSLQDQPENEETNQRLTLKEAILVLGRPFLQRGERIYCGQLVCAWLNLNFNRVVRKNGQPVQYKKKYLPLIDYAIGHILRKRGMTLGA